MCQHSSTELLRPVISVRGTPAITHHGWSLGVPPLCALLRLSRQEKRGPKPWLRRLIEREEAKHGWSDGRTDTWASVDTEFWRVRTTVVDGPLTDVKHPSSDAEPGNPRNEMYVRGTRAAD